MTTTITSISPANSHHHPLARASRTFGVFMAFLIGLAVGTARAEDVRINAATDCHPQVAVNAWWDDDYSMNTVFRTATGLQAILPTQPDDYSTNPDKRATWIRCSVPSTSSFSHTGMIRVKVYGDISGYGSDTRLIKLCSTNVYTGAYSCGAPAFIDFPGSFYKQLLPGNEWSNPAALPQVVIRLYYSDYLRGIVFSDE